MVDYPVGHRGIDVALLMNPDNRVPHLPSFGRFAGWSTPALDCPSLEDKHPATSVRPRPATGQPVKA